MSDSPPTPAATRFWAISSLRQKMFCHLDKKNLARCLTLEKESFGEVVKDLYEEMEYEDVLGVFDKSLQHARSDFYRSLVLRVTVRWHGEGIYGKGGTSRLKIEPKDHAQPVIGKLITDFPNLVSIKKCLQESPTITLHRTNGDITSSTVLCTALIPYGFDLSKMQITPIVNILRNGRAIPTKRIYTFRIQGRRGNTYPRRIWEAWVDQLEPFDKEVGAVVVARLATPPISELIDLLQRRSSNSAMRLRLDLGEQPGMTSLDLTTLLRAADGRIKELYLEDSTETVAFDWLDTLRAITTAEIRNITYLRLPVTPIGTPSLADSDISGFKWKDKFPSNSLKTLQIHFTHYPTKLDERNVNIPLLAESLLTVGGPLCEYLITQRGYDVDSVLENKVGKEIHRIIRLRRESRPRGWVSRRNICKGVSERSDE